MTDAQVTAAISNLADGTPNTVAEFRALFTELFNRAPKTGTIVIKDVSNAYITANFDGTGLGINLEEGYAICNNNNTTRDWAGRVPVAYGGSFTTMGASFGTKDATLVAHSHGMKYASNSSGTKYPETPYIGDTISGNMQGTESAGESGIDKNYQPSIVTLVTMKL